jgi:hypothetical protein
MAPIQVFAADIRFIGVYTPAYKKMLRALRPATVGFVPKPRRSSPEVPQSRANTAAARGEISCRTKGLFLVRDINASYRCSKSIFRVFAQADDKKVPEVRKSKVSVDVEKVEATGDAMDDKMSGMGYRL